MAFLHCHPVEYSEKTIRLESRTWWEHHQQPPPIPQVHDFSLCSTVHAFCSRNQMVSEFIHRKWLYTVEFLRAFSKWLRTHWCSISINVKICFMWTYGPFKHVYFFLPKRHFMQTSEKVFNGRNRGNAWGDELYIVWPSWKEVVITWILLLFLRFNHIP